MNLLLYLSTTTSKYSEKKNNNNNNHHNNNKYNNNNYYSYCMARKFQGVKLHSLKNCEGNNIPDDKFEKFKILDAKKEKGRRL